MPKAEPRRVWRRGFCRAVSRCCCALLKNCSLTAPRRGLRIGAIPRRQEDHDERSQTGIRLYRGPRGAVCERAHTADTAQEREHDARGIAGVRGVPLPADGGRRHPQPPVPAAQRPPRHRGRGEGGGGERPHAAHLRPLRRDARGPAGDVGLRPLRPADARRAALRPRRQRQQGAAFRAHQGPGGLPQVQQADRQPQVHLRGRGGAGQPQPAALHREPQGGARRGPGHLLGRQHALLRPAHHRARAQGPVRR